MPKKLLVLSFVVLFLSGCVSMTPDYSVREQFWAEKNKVIGIATTELPKPSTYQTGNQGLLDVAINSSGASELTKHMNQQDISSFYGARDQLFEYLKAKGYKVKKISEPIKEKELAKFEAVNNADKKIFYSNKDYRPLKQKLGVDKVIVLSVLQAGTSRNYYGFIPTSKPVGTSSMRGQIINLENNQIEWNQSVSRSTPAAGNWDNPPSYPELTEAFKSAFSETKLMLVNSFKQ